MKLNIDSGYCVDYYDQFYSDQEGDALLTALLAIPMFHPQFMGREARRLSAQFGHRYDYSAPLRHGAEPEELHVEWPAFLRSCKERMESIAGPLDSGLVQVYPDGRAGIGWHCDAGHPEVIASLSLGAERQFAMGIRLNARKPEEVWRKTLNHGALLVIPGTVNDRYMHSLIEDKHIKESRANITLRRFPR